jgi:hypothetical protein
MSKWVSEWHLLAQGGVLQYDMVHDEAGGEEGERAGHEPRQVQGHVEGHHGVSE